MSKVIFAKLPGKTLVEFKKRPDAKLYTSVVGTLTFSKDDFEVEYFREALINACKEYVPSIPFKEKVMKAMPDVKQLCSCFAKGIVLLQGNEKLGAFFQKLFLNPEDEQTLHAIADELSGKYEKLFLIAKEDGFVYISGIERSHLARGHSETIIECVILPY